MKSPTFAALLTIAVHTASAPPASADLWMPSVFGDHMVLQRDARVPVWGTAGPGETIRVEIAGRSGSDRAGGDGTWMVRLRELEAGGPYTMTVTGESGSRRFSDVLVGEVWVCSGQSNMQWPVGLSNDAEAEIAAATNPQLRLYYVERTTAESPQKDCKAEWTACTPEAVRDFSAVAYFFGREVQKLRGVPVGLIHTSWGGTTAEAWTSREVLEANPAFEPILSRWDAIVRSYPEALQAYEAEHAAWEQERDKAKDEGREVPREPRPPRGPGDPNRPANLYNAMIAPIAPFGIRGAIWYQGESNAERAYQYRELLPAMIADWRESWERRGFPFLIVQLANFTPRRDDPGDSDWAELREAQLLVSLQRNNGLAVSIDIGDANDIHPRNKQDVGRRLANAAERVAYHDRAFAGSGPIYRSHRIRDGQARIRFDHGRGGLESRGGPPRGFAIAGPDRKFFWADARIDGDSVVVSSPHVANPLAVRYGWANNPDCTLYNAAGLPASPFRTDDWPGVTINNR
jgi:sialate O-acetylesterase